MNEIEQLIADLGADEGSRELSDRVLLALVDTDYTFYNPLIGRHVVKPNRPDPTRSLDDALALVPEGGVIELIVNKTSGQSFAWIGGADEKGGVRECGGTLALALCIALLKERRNSQ